VKLTDSFIKSIKPTQSTNSHSDGQGLVLLVKPSGLKVWRYRYRFLGTAKMLSLGNYPNVSLKDARKKHNELRQILQDGKDPSIVRQEKKLNQQLEMGNSFKSVAIKWHENWRIGKSPQHQMAVLKRLEDDLFPHLGLKPITEITAPQILMVIKKIEARGATDIAKRTFQNCGQVFRYAVAHGLCERNPAKDIKPSDALKPRQETNFARVDEKDLPELLRKIEDYTNQGGNEITQLAMNLMSYTFVRTKELIQARWVEFDLESKQWRIPAERMKMKDPHIVALSVQSLRILKRLQEISGGRELVFPSNASPLKSMSNNTILFALYRMGYHSRMTGHGFRGIASTILHEQGYTHEHIELQLAHQDRNKVSASYNHAKYLPQRAKMMQEWADYLDRIKQPKIIQFPRNA